MVQGRRAPMQPALAAVALVGLLSGCAGVLGAGHAVTRKQVLTVDDPVASPTSPFQADCSQNVAWALAASVGADVVAMNRATLSNVYGSAATGTYDATLVRFRELARRHGVADASRVLWPRILAGCAHAR